MLKLILVGILVGLIVGAYKVLVCLVGDLYPAISEGIRRDIRFALLWFLFTVLAIFTVEVMLKKEPAASSGGINQMYLVLHGILRYNPVKVILTKIFGSLLVIMSGFSLGRVGPSVQLGGSLAMVLGEGLIDAGIAAGVAATLEAPITGVVFTLEVFKIRPTLYKIVTLLFASVPAALVSKLMFPMRFWPSFEYSYGLFDYLLILLLGIFTGLYSSAFMQLLFKLRKFLVKRSYKFVPSLLFSWFFILLLPQVLGGGKLLLWSLMKESIVSLDILILLLILKSIHTLFSAASDAPGGLFCPSLAMGAILGKKFVVPGMVGVLAGVYKAPLTPILLMFETGVTPKVIPGLLLSSLISYLITIKTLKTE